MFLGVRYIPALIFSFVITDFFIGFHGVTFFTWGSIFIIGLFSKFFANNILSRLSGALLGACIFFIITNFGVWTLGSYDYTLNGLLLCFTVALPFFGYTLISTFVFSTVIETVYKFKNYKIKSIN